MGSQEAGRKSVIRAKHMAAALLLLATMSCTPSATSWTSWNTKGRRVLTFPQLSIPVTSVFFPSRSQPSFVETGYLAVWYKAGLEQRRIGETDRSASDPWEAGLSCLLLANINTILYISHHSTEYCYPSHSNNNGWLGLMISK